jgi:hypothetical protein
MRCYAVRLIEGKLAIMERLDLWAYFLARRASPSHIPDG